MTRSTTSGWSGTLTLVYYFFLLLSVVVQGQDLSDAQLDAINKRLEESAQQSWELGTRAETILEGKAQLYSVFSNTPLPPPSTPDTATLSALQPFFDIADGVLAQLSPKVRAAVSLQPNGAAADPASIGVCVLIANLTKEAHGGRFDYDLAARNEIDYLYNSVPRTPDGAISHREDQLQLWSDSVYMTPPFLAYYGVVTGNQSTIHDAYDQIKLYRDYLRDPSTGMWKHVVLGEWQDNGIWSTGNGWAAGGILRVYATIKNSEFAGSFQQELQDLASWVQEIHDGMYAHLDETGIFANYADRSLNDNNFYDAASTSILASTVYRAAKILGQQSHLGDADKSRNAILRSSSPRGTSDLFTGYDHIRQDGVLFPVVDPHAFGSQTSDVSPEGQAFLLQMYYAWSDLNLNGTTTNQ